MCSTKERSPLDTLRFQVARKLLVGNSDNIILEDGVREWIYRLPDSEDKKVRNFFVGVSGAKGTGSDTVLVLFEDQKDANYDTQEKAEASLSASKDWKDAQEKYGKLFEGLRTSLRKGGRTTRQNVEQWTRQTGWAVLDFGCPQHAKLAASGAKLNKSEFFSLAQYAHEHGITAKRMEHVCM